MYREAKRLRFAGLPTAAGSELSPDLANYQATEVETVIPNPADFPGGVRNLLFEAIALRPRALYELPIKYPVRKTSTPPTIT
jgi:hypothetical protein